MDADGQLVRTVVRNSVEVAEDSYRDVQQRLEEQIRQAKAKTGGGYAVTTPPDVRREILRLAAKHDRVLGEEFLEKYKQQKEQEATDAKNRFGRADEAVDQRLGLARQQLEAGDDKRALQLAG